ncbi:hypothetical protein jhhlp_008886 [Lomentospora prolificans]|uniref:Uncharacterized protein n=1 Tax=Lomentospora prolificans TaxID=41688 RepID=A0A2N3MZA5_9PEZI|nr:hypothetical protein jhhlp_008886 [Lomentospora prolificans]
MADTTNEFIQPDEGAEVDSVRSSLTSISESILNGVIGEGQRTYAAYGKEGKSNLVVLMSPGC